MKKIDFKDWDRKEHYEFFHQLDIPFYSFTANIDITKFKEFQRKNDIPFYYGFIYLTMEVINSLEEFRVRKHGNEIIIYDKIEPSFTDMKEGTKLHKICKCPIEGDIKTYALKAKEVSSKQERFFVTAEEQGRDDYVYITSMPWLTYTAATNTITFDKDDFIPRVAWGKFFEQDDRVLMPFTIHANHCALDGIHVNELYEAMQKRLDSY